MFFFFFFLFVESFRLFAAAFPSLLRQPLLHLCLTTRLPSWKIRPGGASHRTAATSTSGVFWTSSGPRGGPVSSHIGADSPPPRSKRGGSWTHSRLPTPKQTDLFQRVCLKGKCPPPPPLLVWCERGVCLAWACSAEASQHLLLVFYLCFELGES